MATKWRNRVRYGVWAFMVTFGLSGLLVIFNSGNSYVGRDYYHTPEFRRELDLFSNYLDMFELNSVPIEIAKQSLTASEDEINEYRSRFRNLTSQMNSLKDEYAFRIDEALSADNQEAADFYKTERDKKIEDMTKVFKSDEYVRAKIIIEKEEELEKYYEQRKQYYSDYLKYKEQLQYYFKNSATGKIYTNLNVANDESAKDNMHSVNWAYITSYSSPVDYSINYWTPINGHLRELIIPFEGEIAVSRDLPSSSSILIKYNRYKQVQIALWVYAFASIAALIVCVLFARKAKVILPVSERWMSYYNWLPIDVRAVFISLTGFVTIPLLFSINGQFISVFNNPFVYGWDMFISLAFTTIGLLGVLVQGKFLASSLKGWQSIKTEWETSLLNKTGQSIKGFFSKAKRSLQEAFLNKSTGIQLFILLLIVFGLGLAAIIAVDPFFMLLYVFMLAFIGLPIVTILIKRIGSFNRIVLKTNELAVGKLGDDLQVSGKSVLAALAENINVLKQGVKTLQNEQAKSERLKTELITNVSHDLRTPLTSIITYTELLKKDDLSSEERTAYVEIIDRKSKRLKVLIDDLFEVSKMASGNVELTKEKIDLVQLLQQALAEYDNLINDSSLQFRITKAEEPIYALVDGKKLWRVFDNLIGNVLNYSLENSRVYITIQSLNKQVIITFKNISKYEISENMDELFERFKRGDASRHTEGSGLGLAIAKSIVDVHEGSLDIEIDGDLFKVTISLKVEN